MLIIQNKISKEFNLWLKEQDYSSIFILVDENTFEHCYKLLDLKIPHKIIKIASGEKNKNLSTCQYIWESLLNNNADRNSLFINLGGGVICDMGAFCASTYKRGIDFINISTTLLSQVDASIGSKTGIDFQGQKNMLGLFSEAKQVFIDDVFLNTLSKRELLSGFGEVLKHGIIQNKYYFNDCIKEFQNNTINWINVIEKSISIKKSIVEKDPKEQGLRKILNFGHTIGHALESYSLENHKKSLLHGESVVLGMIAELKLSVIKGLLDENIVEKYIIDLLSIYKFEDVESFKDKDVLQFIKNDKKNNSGKIKCVLLKDIGQAVYDIELSENEIIQALDFLKNRIK